MKLAISLPDDLYRDLDRCAKRLKVPRSRLLAEGARLVVARNAATDPTAAWNEVLDAEGQPGDEPAAAQLRRKSKRAVRKAAGPW